MDRETGGTAPSGRAPHQTDPEEFIVSRPAREPRYWVHEMSGILRAAMMAYLMGDDLGEEQIATIRAYLRQWIEAPVWKGEKIDGLRIRLDVLKSRRAIESWMRDALAEGLDPL